MAHFSEAHAQLLEEDNVNFTHLLTNIRKDPRFENLLMRIMARDDGVDFNLRSDIISELATYGVIARGADGMCEIVNPIYLYCILQAFKAVVNGLEDEYLHEDSREGFLDYLTPTGQIDMGRCLIISEISLHGQGSKFWKSLIRQKNRLADIFCLHISISLLKLSAVLCILKYKPAAVGWTSLLPTTRENVSWKRKYGEATIVIRRVKSSLQHILDMKV